ncbi:MAG: hypothetical protein R2939_10155 [Kofleriaceae bacterium]
MVTAVVGTVLAASAEPCAPSDDDPEDFADFIGGVVADSLCDATYAMQLSTGVTLALLGTTGVVAGIAVRERRRAEAERAHPRSIEAPRPRPPTPPVIPLAEPADVSPAEIRLGRRAWMAARLGRCGITRDALASLATTAPGYVAEVLAPDPVIARCRAR